MHFPGAQAASLDIDLNNIQIYMGNDLVDFQGQDGILNAVSSQNRAINITMPPASTVAITSPTGLELTITPTTNAVFSCENNISKISINTPQDAAPQAYTLNLKNTLCNIPAAAGLKALGAGATDIGGAITQSAVEIFNGLTGEEPLNIAESLGAISAETQKVVRELRANPAVVTTVTKVVLPISVTISAASAGVLTVTASVGSASFAFNLSQILQQLSFFRFYALAFIRLRRKKPWGKVYDKFSGKPLRGATVQVYESTFKKLKDAQITDAEGRFMVQVPPGTYYLKVLRRGFTSYETPPLVLSAQTQLLNLEIPLESESTTQNNVYIAYARLWNKIKSFVDAINPYLLAFGTFVGIITVVILPTIFNYAVFTIYILLDALKIYLAFHLIKPFGTVRAANNTSLPLAIVRIYEEKTNHLLTTKVTDENGRFGVLLSPGAYYLTCGKAGFLPYRSQTILLQKSGLASLDIVLKAENR